VNATAIAHSNIALIKYWGKADAALNLPAAGSISATLAPLATTTTCTWRTSGADSVVLNGTHARGRDLERVIAFIDLIRDEHGLDWKATIETDNNFPTAAGLASSASGFAALALAATAAADLEYSMSALSGLARRGSGSAARSLHGGFVQMHAGSVDNPKDAVAEQLAPKEHWDLRALLVLTTEGRKKVSSTVGMNRTQQSSPYFDRWIDSVNASLPKAADAIGKRDFERLASLAEASALQMHASAIAAEPGVLYWNGVTVELIHRVRALREEQGLDAFFTIDAGPHVKVFTTAKDLDTVSEHLLACDGVVDIMHARMGGPARLLESSNRMTTER
jgi:diphosphomevalonate decarboxylase